MIKITIIAMGKLKESFLREASDEYKKRLSSICDLNIIELEPVKLSENPSEIVIQNALDTEAEKIAKKIPQNCFLVPLCVEGKLLTSEEFSQQIEKSSVNGKSGVCLIIGSSYGLSEKIKNMANLKLSVSKMTFPHQLFRILLLEQVYRAFKISGGGTYHK